VDDVLHVAVAGVAIDHHRQAGRRHDVAHAGADLAVSRKSDVRNAIARADQLVAADRICVKPGALDQPRRQRIIGARQQQRLLAREHVFPRRFIQIRHSP
jgi:hypothetical protein